VLYLPITVQITDDLYRFGNFFNHLDNFNGDDFLYLTSGGIPAAKPADEKGQRATLAKAESESEDEVLDGGEEGG
jgi:tRNA pseudouridine38-40 synthase